MLASYNWLCEYTEYKKPADVLARELTALGLEVGFMNHVGKPIDHLAIGQILEIVKHPDASKLNVTKVQIEKEILQIVCGANNIAVGQKIIAALPGAILPGNFEIKPTSIRGVESFGMICSKSELGMEKESDGIWVLPENTKLSINPNELIGEEDWILDVELTANRADCMNILGIAQEVSLLTGKRICFKEPLQHLDKTGFVEIQVEDKVGCPLYTARLIKNVQVKKSPDWMIRRLERHGIRSINNIVDITNYVLIEYGQPLHAFDYDLLEGKKIIVRRANKGETLQTLDENIKLDLTEEDLVICDSTKPVCLAGVMGGTNSCVSEKTTTILLESALFNPISVRRTSKRHKIMSDSSLRFEKGINPERVKSALNYAVELIVEYANGEIASGIKAIQNGKIEKKDISFRYNYLEKKLGVSIEKTKVNQYFSDLGFELKATGSEVVNVIVPPRRHDINYEWDLVEEVARLYGYNNIPETIPYISNSNLSIESNFEKKHIDIARNLGYNQAINFSFIDKSFSKFTETLEENIIKISNPLSSDFEHMRTSLIYGLVKNMKYNLEHFSNEGNKYFEIGNVFAIEKESYSEIKSIAFCGTGGFEKKDWINAGRSFDFYDLSGDIEEYLNFNGFKMIEILPYECKTYSPIACAQICVNKTKVGTMGLLSREILNHFGLSDQDIYYAELNLQALSELKIKPIKFKEPSPYPSVYRDIAFVIEKNEAIAPYLQTIAKVSPLITGVTVSNVYVGEKVAEHQKSVVFSIAFMSRDKTLQSNEIDALINEVITTIGQKHQAKLR